MRGLLVDYGGVLTASIFESFRAYCESVGLARDAMRQVLSEDGEAVAEVHRLEVGHMSEEEFAERLARRLGIPSADGLLPGLFARAVLDRKMIAAVRAVRASGIRTGLVSNSWGLRIYDRLPLPELFDAVVLSGEVGLRKPQAEIYLLAAGRLGLAPESCVFVDDLRPNCDAAAALGMDAVHHREAEETLATLERLLGLPLR